MSNQFEIPEDLKGESLPAVLLTYQGGLYGTVSRNALTVCEKSRRIGVTWGLGALAVLTSAAAKSAGGQDTLYLGTSMDMAREFIDACAMWARAFMPAASEVEEFLFKDQEDGREDRHIQAFRINFGSGFDIVALSSSPRSLRGRQGLVIIDEAAFHDDLDEVLKAAMALIIWGGRVVVVSTHNGEDNPFNQLIKEIRQGKRPGSVFRCDFDEALADGLYKRICLVMGKDWSPEGEAEWRQEVIDFYGEDAEEELFCVPKSGEGAYLSRALIESRMDGAIPVIRWSQPASFAQEPEHIREAETRDFCEMELLPILKRLEPGERHSLGMDFGRSGDLSVMWPLAIQKNLVRRTPFVLELSNIPFKQQEQILYYICDRLPRFSGAALDARGNGQALAEYAMQKYGSSLVEQVMLSLDWYRRHMPLYKAAFEDATIVVPMDDDIATDHRAITVVRGVPKLPETGGRTKGRDGRQRHGDTAIAGALAYSATLIDAMPIDVTSSGVERAGAKAFDEDTPSEIDHGTGFGVARRTHDLGGF